MFPKDIETLTAQVLDRARKRGLRIATAQSCTGGLVAAALTAIAGSSDVVQGGVISYANTAKSRLLGVPPGLIAEHGAVSEPVALAMAEGARRALDVDLAVAITGVAGPGGGTADKPVGLVHFAAASSRETRHHAECFGDIGREKVRLASVKVALQMLLDLMADGG